MSALWIPAITACRDRGRQELHRRVPGRVDDEIDGADPTGRIGWSVIIADEVTNPSEVHRVESIGVDPSAPGFKAHWVRIRAKHRFRSVDRDGGRRGTRLPRVILLGYDGSDDARAAIEHAGELLGPQPATVLTVWEPFIEMLAHTSSGFGLGPGMVNIGNIEEIDVANRHGAQSRAEEGADLARRAGLNAQPRTRAQVTTVAAAILEEASALGANAVVVGSRGLTGIKSLLLGSVSHGLIQHADRAVIVVPSAEVAVARANRAGAAH